MSLILGEGTASTLVRILTWTCIAVALFQLFRGDGQHIPWVILALSVPSARVVLSGEYRQSFLKMLESSWVSLEAFHASPVRMPLKAILVWVAGPFAILFLMNTRVQVGDNSPVFIAASSIVREGNLECGEFLDLPGWPSLKSEGPLTGALCKTATGIYSNYPAGPLQAALPVAIVSRLLGADLDDIKVHERLQKFTAALLSAICLGLFFAVALYLVPARPAFVATLLLGFGSAMFSTIAVGIWQHGGIVLWSLVFLLCEFQQTRERSRVYSLIQGIALGSMLPWRPSAVIIAGVLGVWLLVRRPKDAVLVSLIAGFAFLPWALFYWQTYGNLLGPTHIQAAGGNWRWTTPDGFLGVLVSPGRGILVYQPWLVLAAFWLVPGVRSVIPLSGSIGLMLVCALCVASNLVMVGAWHMWWGGWCYGSRLSSEILPFAALLCLRPIAFLWEFSAGRKCIVGLLLLSFLIHGSCIYLGADRWDGSPNNIDLHPERLWQWDDPPFLYPILKHSRKISS